jgi:hypothetical protein
VKYSAIFQSLSNMAKSRIIALLLLVILPCAFSGCGLLVEAVRNGAEDARMLRAGTVVQGDGFSVRVPEDGLLLVRNSPRRGFLSLRFPQRIGFCGSYNVYPFTLADSTPTLQSAWQTIFSQMTNADARRAYRILSQHSGTWRGSAAWFHTSCMPATSRTGGFVAASCLIRRGNTYYVISRSIPLLLVSPEDISRQTSRAERQLESFLTGIQFP